MLLTNSSSLAAGCSCTSARRARAPDAPTALTARKARGSGSGSAARRVRCRALPRAGEDDDLLLSNDCPVPPEQQPLNELKQLQDMFMFDLATVPLEDFGRRLGVAWVGFFMTLGLPVSAFTFDVHRELPQCLAAASAGSCFVVTVLVWRLYLGWQHVGDRLISATVDYEETGWYDGQTWVKTPAMLMRDRLTSNYTVKPALARLKRTLLGLGGALVASMLLLAVLPPPPVSSAAYPAGGQGPYQQQQQQLQQAGGGYSSEAAARYEPWAQDGHGEDGGDEGDGEGDSEAPRFDMRSHMMLQQ